jgi:hypothetical protein
VVDVCSDPAPAEPCLAYMQDSIVVQVAGHSRRFAREVVLQLSFLCLFYSFAIDFA